MRLAENGSCRSAVFDNVLETATRNTLRIAETGAFSLLKEEHVAGSEQAMQLHHCW